ncbi:MAG: DNA-directed RNA polymerase subunit A'' [Nanoarchaeota archaeon]|nr:DNA-directed RNA polymerase subunit A'' [Nanoarchaeota archaeon]
MTKDINYEELLPKKLLDELKKRGEDAKLSAKQYQEALVLLHEEYENTKISPGEAIGIITAESFGEPGTQMTLNVFHFAGVAEVAVNQGLPRLIELFDARKEIKTPLIDIYLDKELAKDPEKVRRLAASIKESVVEEIASDFSIDVARLEVSIILDKQKMKSLNITNLQITKALENEIKNATIKDEGDSIALKTKLKENELMETYKLKEKAKTVFIKGVKGITQVLPVKQNNEFMIIAAGDNYKDVLNFKGIDPNRTTTNSIFEVQKTLGIEAARQTIMNEAQKVIEDQGLEVDMRHIIFIADVMTTTGTIKGITRSGIAGEKESVLARASFETPIEHLVDASLTGEVDYLNSVIENVMLNQTVPLGTGLPDLIAHMNKKAEEKKE